MFHATHRPWLISLLALALGLMGCAPDEVGLRVSTRLEPIDSASVLQVRGTVLGLDGAPAANVAVIGHLVSNNAGGLVSNNVGTYRVQSADRSARTGADGSFVLGAPVGAELNVEAILSDEVKAIAQQIPGGKSGLSLQLAYTGTIEGRVTAPEQPQVTDFLGVDVYVPGTSYQARTDAAGHFTITGVAPGTFHLVASKTGLGQANLMGLEVRSRQTAAIAPLALRLDTPALLAADPPQAPVGTRVTLTGRNFKTSSGATLQVYFGNAVATELQRLDDQTLIATVPPGAVTSQIAITVNGTTSNGLGFVVVKRLVSSGNQVMTRGATMSLPVSFFDTSDTLIASPSYTLSSTGSAVTVQGGVLSAQVTGDAELAVRIGALSETWVVRVVERPWTVSSPIGGSTDLVKTVGQDARFYDPLDVAIDPRNGELVVADRGNDVLQRIDRQGKLIQLIGTSERGDVDAPVASASLNRPSSVVVTEDGTLLFTEPRTHRLRQVTPAGQVVTLTGSDAGLVDGGLAEARFNGPEDLVRAADGTLYVADLDNHVIRKIAAGKVSTFAGSGVTGFRDGIGTQAAFSKPGGLLLAPDGTLYVADRGNGAIRKISPAGVVTTLVGDGTPGTVNGTGARARFQSPHGMLLMPGGDLLVSDDEAHVLRLVTPAGVTFPFGGLAGQKARDDGLAPAARFSQPSGMTWLGDGTILLADTYSDTLRLLVP